MTFSSPFVVMLNLFWPFISHNLFLWPIKAILNISHILHVTWSNTAVQESGHLQAISFLGLLLTGVSQHSYAS